MNVLIVCSGTKINFNFSIHKAFIYDQIKAISKKHQVNFEVFIVKEKGLMGYLKSVIKLNNYLRKNKFDIVHAHYSYCGLIAVFQRRVSKIITYHGSDINIKRNNIISLVAIILADWNIMVSERLKEKAFINNKKTSVIPCGIDLNTFLPIEKHAAKYELGFNMNTNYILFASSFKNQIKNYPLAKNAILFIDKQIELIELDGYSRKQVSLLMNASDLLILTSLSEGSPQVVKEAMACNCPVVATDVGDVRWLFGDLEGHFIASFDPQDFAEKIEQALEFAEQKGRTRGRQRITELGLDSETVARKIIEIYKKVLS